MKVQLFENPVLYGLTMGGLFAVLAFAVSAISGVKVGNLAGAILAGVIFGVIMTWWGRRASTPPT
jgi:branched-subunit amino acid ABC-type transport system permease component